MTLHVCMAILKLGTLGVRLLLCHLLLLLQVVNIILVALAACWEVNLKECRLQIVLILWPVCPLIIRRSTGARRVTMPVEPLTLSLEGGLRHTSVPFEGPLQLTHGLLDFLALPGRSIRAQVAMKTLSFILASSRLPKPTTGTTGSAEVQHGSMAGHPLRWLQSRWGTPRSRELWALAGPDAHRRACHQSWGGWLTRR